MATLYALGSNGAGQLGIGHQEDVSVPKEILFDDDVLSPGQVTIRAGGNHTLLLPQSGLLYCSGNTSAGACGLTTASTEVLSQFKRVQFDRQPRSETESKVLFCAATWEASIVVKDDGNGSGMRVYSFGTGNKGELGLGEFIFRTSTAQLIKDFPPPGTHIIDLAACVSHVVTVLSTGEVYGWGSGRKGQIGQPEEIIYSPRKIEGIDFKVTRAVCGREFTVLFGAPQAGEYVFHGVDKWDIGSSLPVPLKDWANVGAGWGTLCLLMDDGKLVSCGRNDHGQIPPPDLPEISDIAVGSEHVVALTSNGEVLTWGWGEHGNCGPHTTQGDVKGRWNIIASSKYLPAGQKIVAIGAGCATSWICINPS